MAADQPIMKDDRRIRPARVSKKFGETIYLDSYDDIFSDFDYGPYESRRVSEDFLHELETRLKYASNGKIDLLLVVPDGERDREVEARAKKRLKQVFYAKAHAAEVNLHAIRRNGLFDFAVGSCILVLASALAIFFPGTQGFAFYAVGAIITPAGWFWGIRGLERIFAVPVELSRRRELYGMLAESIISFDEASAVANPVSGLYDTAKAALPPQEQSGEE
ncbi:Uncharacterised protein [uncultured archaeon]|nr:Uncharacterised protein [uncultured archaeon]